MANCNTCGNPIPEGQGFCPVCGTAAPVQQTSQNDIVGKAKDLLLNTPDYTPQFQPNDIEANKVMALLSYIGILVLVPIFAAKDSPYARFHANQGLILLLCNLAYGFVSGLIGGVLALILPVLGILAGGLLGLLGLVFLGAMILGIYNAFMGKAKELPFIGKFRLLK